METVVNRIIEIERESALEIQRAEETSRKRIEAYRLSLEEEKNRIQSDIVSQENNRLSEALRALARQTEEASRAAGETYKSRFHAPAAIDAVKERIVAVLLAG